MDRIALLDKLRVAPVLRQLPLGELDRLVSRGKLRDLGAGERLLEEGRAGEEIFLVLSGRVSVRRALRDEEDAVIAVRQEGDWVGDMALLGNAPRAASVRAETPAQVLEVSRDAFLGALAGRPEAAVDLLRTVTRRLRESDGRLIELLREKNESLAAVNRKLRRENWQLHGHLDDAHGFERFLGASQAARRVRDAARRAAASDLPVLLLGETGTGKEVLARAIHNGSDRAGRSFVAVNCSLFNAALLESELFGHVRGAFTGATASRVGLVEAASGGTLFLDEIADMPLALQGALLRFLELGEFRRLGETRVRHARVRVIAATFVDLDRAAREGAFRSDLLYRLDVVRIAVPPLRERRGDIPQLASHYVERIAERLGVEPLRLSAEMLDALARYRFPGNVRELENELERLYVSHDPGSQIGRRDLSPKVREEDPASRPTYTAAVRAFKAGLVRHSLEEADGDRGQAAARLGVHRSNLTRMIRELGIEDVPRRRRERHR